MTASIASQAEAFFSWWGRELGSLVPHGVTWVAWNERPPVLRPEADGGYSVRLDADAATSPIFGDAAGIASALVKAGAGNAVVLRLPIADVLVLSVDLPEKAVARAQDILSLEIESSTPFSADEATFDYLIDGEAIGSMRRVKTLVAKNSIIERRIKDLARANLSVAKIDVEGSEGINLLPNRLRQKRRFPFPRETAVLLGSTLLLAASAYHRQNVAIEGLETKKAALLIETEGVRSAASEANAAVANIANLDDVVEGNPRALYVLAALTEALGDDVWITELKISGREVAVSGAASSASEALARIEASPAFAKAAFSSTVFTDKAGEEETFSAKFQVEPRAVGVEDLNLE